MFIIHKGQSAKFEFWDNIEKQFPALPGESLFREILENKAERAACGPAQKDYKNQRWTLPYMYDECIQEGKEVTQYLRKNGGSNITRLLRAVQKG